MFNFVERTVCPSCDSPRNVTKFVAGFASSAVGDFIRKSFNQDPLAIGDWDYHLSECRDCGLVFQRFVGDDAFLKEFYSSWVWDTSNPEKEAPGYKYDIANYRESRDAHECMTVASFLQKPLSAITALDYGMGLALWVRIAAKLGVKAYGFDLSPVREEFAQQHGVPTLKDHEIANMGFDFINTEQVFEHVPDPLGLAQKLAGALNPGGILKISVPSAESIDITIAELETAQSAADLPSIMPMWPLEHINAFRKRSLDRLAKSCGLIKVRPTYFQRYAFLRHSGAVNLRHPAKTLKESIRPLYQYRNSANLYEWFQKPLFEGARG